MLLYKIDHGSLYITDRSGNLLRRLCNDVAFATYDEEQKIFLVTFLNGRVETKDTNGYTLRVICQEATEAKFYGKDIVVRRKDGRNELRDKVGFQLRWL